MRYVIIISCIFLLPAMISAQAPAKVVSAITRLRFLEGIWRGEGWIQSGGKKQHFNETETVSLKAGSTILQIDIYGTAVENKSAVINNGLAIVHFDTAGLKYNMLLYQGDGSITNGELEITDANVIEIRLQRRGGDTRFIIEVRDGTWHEKAYYREHGKEESQVFEMTLTKERS